jgi:hypothetical protein
LVEQVAIKIVESYLNLLKDSFNKIVGMLQIGTSNNIVIVDSVPLEDIYDMEAQ